jgi:2-alkyl-3-oxoalkanoate reductase
MYRQILLTGATGALGPALAAELVRAQAADRIAILMRCPPAEMPARFARWRDVVQPLLASHETAGLERLHPVCGDICQADLGLNGAADALRHDTDVVVHAAADTGFSSPPARQWAVNVDGTRRTIEWASQCPGLHRFLLVSSVFVSGSRTGRIDETVTPEPPDFITHYQRTKWEAEHVALASGLPVGVARISLVLGSHATGGVHRTGAVHSLIKWIARGLVPAVPGLPEATGDVIATETAARCLSRAVLADWGNTQGPIWHIAAGEQAPRLTDLIEFVCQHLATRSAWRRKRMVRPQMVEQEQFNRVIASGDNAGHPALTHALRSINGFFPNLLYPKTYATPRAEALWGGPLPRYDWRQTMARVIQVCCPDRE